MIDYPYEEKDFIFDQRDRLSGLNVRATCRHCDARAFDGSLWIAWRSVVHTVNCRLIRATESVR